MARRVEGAPSRREHVRAALELSLRRALRARSTRTLSSSSSPPCSPRRRPTCSSTGSRPTSFAPTRRRRRSPRPSRRRREGHRTASGCSGRRRRTSSGSPRSSSSEHGGEVPRTLDELIELPGVGRKTANVVLGVAFNAPGGRGRRHPRAAHLAAPRLDQNTRRPRRSSRI